MAVEALPVFCHYNDLVLGQDIVSKGINMVKFRNDFHNYAVSWMDLHRDSKNLARRLVEKGSWFGLIAITRGGLVPAAIVARELGVRNIDTLCISSYDEQVMEGLELIKKPEEAIAVGGKGWLVIDDLVDTGNTAKEARKLLPQAHFATVYAKAEGISAVDTFVKEFEQDTWVVFPGDTEPQYIRPRVDGGGATLNEKED